MKKYLFLFLAVTLLACSKEEGYGGLASISGKVYAKDYNSNGVLVSENYLGGVKVYISKHNDTSFYDDLDTAFDGSFKFDFLQEGTYDIWVFGDCDSCTWDQNYVKKTIEIGSRKANVVLEDLVITI